MPMVRKRFGQHFLCDMDVVDRIVAAIHPTPKEHLVEIGPGQGALTAEVLKLAKSLEVIELDRDLLPELMDRCERYGQLIIHSADALTFDFAHLKKDNRLLRVFGNLPYNISTPLLFHLLDYIHVISDMTFMLQKEVAYRLAAKADSNAYGRLSVMVQYHCEVERLFDVSPTAFYPPPNVQSSIVKLKPYRALPYTAKNYQQFAIVVREAFGHRRKTLRNSLKGIVSDETWAQLAIRSDLRAETLSVKDFVEISNAI